jgi:hypothetical protein
MRCDVCGRSDGVRKYTLVLPDDEGRLSVDLCSKHAQPVTETFNPGLRNIPKKKGATRTSHGVGLEQQASEPYGASDGTAGCQPP